MPPCRLPAMQMQTLDMDGFLAFRRRSHVGDNCVLTRCFHTEWPRCMVLGLSSDLTKSLLTFAPPGLNDVDIFPTHSLVDSESRHFGFVPFHLLYSR